MALADWRPDTARVGALLTARFGGAAPPTEATAELVGVLQREIRTSLDRDPSLVVLDATDLDAGTWAEYAADTVALGVAAYLENGLLPEQNDDLNSGPAEFFRRRYQEHAARLAAACGDAPVA